MHQQLPLAARLQGMYKQAQLLLQQLTLAWQVILRAWLAQLLMCSIALTLAALLALSCFHYDPIYT
jgi:hypothetical protein